MANILGWSIVRNSEEPQANTKAQSFSAPAADDGAVQIADSGIRNTFIDIDGAIESEAQLLTRYRELSLQPELAAAIDDIVNEVVAYDEKSPLVTLNMEDLEKELPARIRDIITQEFDNVLRLYDFNNAAYEIVRRWYIDGRMYYQVLIDADHPELGIQELRYIDPRLIRKVRIVKREPSKNGTQTTIVKKVIEYYIYREKANAVKPMNTSINYAQGVDAIKISKDAIVHATSGLMDPTNTTVLSYLHKANRPLNQLRAIEDASVINRLVRAPMRRKMTLEVGSLPKAKAEQYLREQMVNYKNKLTYDSSTGGLKDSRHFMTMLEDFWLPARRGVKSLDVENLQGAADWDDLDDLNYFREQLMHALNIPVTRLTPGDAFSLGRPTEITRDELKFAKFISRLRLRFSVLFKSALSKQLILKGILNEEECKEVMAKIAFDYKRDNFFTELKQAEITQTRFNNLTLLQPFVGTYVSEQWVKKNILQQEDEEIEQMSAEMQEDIAVNIKRQALTMEMQAAAGILPPPDETGKPPASNGPPD